MSLWMTTIFLCALRSIFFSLRPSFRTAHLSRCEHRNGLILPFQNRIQYRARISIRHMHGNILRFVTFKRRMAVVALLFRSWASFRAERQIMGKIHVFNLKIWSFLVWQNLLGNSVELTIDSNSFASRKEEEEKCKQNRHHCHIHPI